MMSTALSLVVLAGVSVAPVPSQNFSTPVQDAEIGGLCQTATYSCRISPPQPIGSACACGAVPGFVTNNPAPAEPGDVTDNPVRVE